MKVKFKMHPPKSGIVVKGPKPPNQYSFEIAGDNHEVVVRSDPYYSLSNARRGLRDLIHIMGEAQNYPVDKAPVVDIYDNALPTETLRRIEADEQEAAKSEPGSFSRHDEVPRDNPDALGAEDEG